LNIEVWYFYDGVAGTQDVFAHAAPLTKDGQILSGSGTLAELKIINHKALAEMDMSHTPKLGKPDTSTHVEIRMESDDKGTFHRQVFPYRKTWTPEPPK